MVRLHKVFAPLMECPTAAELLERRMNRIEIMNGTGHTLVEYDPTTEAGVAMGRAEFDKAMSGDTYHSQGRRAFDTTGDVGKPMDGFDPSVESITIIAPVAGG